MMMFWSLRASLSQYSLSTIFNLITALHTYESICCGYSFELQLHRQVDAIQIGTHNICLYKEVDKKYAGCNLKTSELLDCALIGVCAVTKEYSIQTPKKVREKSRECHNHKPQTFPDPKRKRKPTNLNKHKPNKRTKSTKISSLFPKQSNPNTKRTEKHKNKMTRKERPTSGPPP